MGDTGDTAFSMSELQTNFKLSTKNIEISLEEYVAGYEQVIKFLNLLGTVFGWVASDVQAKVDSLKKCMNGPDAEHYKTAKAMIEYEVEAGVILWKKSSDSSGSRNLLILHRALQYVTELLGKLDEVGEDEKITNISREAYETTLMKFHPWVVQKAAKIAMNLLPTRNGLVQKVAPAGDPESLDKAWKEFPGAVESMRLAYDEVELLCQKHNLQSLHCS